MSVKKNGFVILLVTFDRYLKPTLPQLKRRVSASLFQQRNVCLKLQRCFNSSIIETSYTVFNKKHYTDFFFCPYFSPYLIPSFSSV